MTVRKKKTWSNLERGLIDWYNLETLTDKLFNVTSWLGDVEIIVLGVTITDKVTFEFIY